MTRQAFLATIGFLGVLLYARGASAACTTSECASCCSGTGACDHSGQCVCLGGNTFSDGTACASDGNPCTLDQCSAGYCAHPVAPASTVCRSATSICDVADTCNGFNFCRTNLVAPSTVLCRSANGVCDA